jgi:hypothetical protein
MLYNWKKKMKVYILLTIALGCNRVVSFTPRHVYIWRPRLESVVGLEALEKRRILALHTALSLYRLGYTSSRL